jgi:hypothetical protein
MHENWIKACIYANKIEEQYWHKDGLMMETIGNITVNKENDRNSKTVAVYALKTMAMHHTLYLKGTRVQ